MANRSITTKVAVEGEQQYTSALKTINAELKTLQSQLELTSSKYRTNANTEEALAAKSANLNAVLAKEQEKVNTLKQALENAKNAQSKWSELMTQSASKINSNSSKMSELEARIKKNGEAYDKYGQQLEKAKAHMDQVRQSTETKTRADVQTEKTITALEQKMEALDQEIQNDTTAMNKLGKENKTLGQTLTSATTGYNTATQTAEKYQTAINKEQVTINTLDDSLKKNKQYLNEAKTSSDGCATSIDKFGNEVKNANAELDGMGDGVSTLSDGFNVLSSVITTLGIDQAVSKITDALKECVSTASDFGWSMATVEAVSGATDDQLSQLSSMAEEWAGSTIYLASDIADTYVQMGRAGWNAEDMLDSMTGVMGLASAAGEDLSDVTTIVTTALTAFGEDASSASHFADVLSETAADSSTNVAQLGEAFKAVGTTAGNLDYEIDDVATALGAMASQSLRGELAGTALSTALTRMSGANANASKEMEELGLSMYDSSGQARPLLEFLNDLRSAFANFGDDAQAAQVAAYKLAGQRGMKGLMAIVNTSDEDWDSLTESIKNCEGAADAMADTQLDTYAGDVQLLQSAIEGLELTIGNAMEPALRSVIENVTAAISSITDFISKNEAAIPVLAGVTAAMTAFAGSVTVGTAAVAAYKIVAESTLLATMGTLATILGPIAIGIGLVTAAFAANEYAAEKDADSLLYMERKAEEANAAVAELKSDHESYQEKSSTLAGTNQELIASLTDLVSHYHGSAAAAEEINSIIATLNENVPDLDLSFDSLNGTLNMTAEDLERTAEAAQLANDVTEAYNYKSDMKDAMDDAYDAASQLYYKYLDDKKAYDDYIAAVDAGTEKIDLNKQGILETNMNTSEAAWRAQRNAADAARAAYSEASAELLEVETQYDSLTEAQGENTDAADKQTAAAERCAERAEAQAEAEAEAAEETEKANESLHEINSSIKNASGSTEELRDEYEDLQKQYEKLDGAGNTYLSGLVKQRLEQMNLAITTQEVTEALGDHIDVIGGSASGLAQMLINAGMSVDDFADLVDDNFSDIENNFEKLDTSEQKSLQDMVDALNSNNKTTYDWQTKIAQAWKMAVDSGDQNAMDFVKNLDEMGVDSYDAVTDLVNGGTSALTKAADAWGNAIDTSTKHALLQFAENKGITYQEAYDMAHEGVIAMNDATGEYEDVGTAATDAAGTGAEDSTALTDAVNTVMSQAVDAGTTAAEDFSAVGEAIDTNIGAGTTDNAGIIPTALTTTLTTVKTGVNVSYFSSIGLAIDQGIAKGIRSGAGLIRTAAQSAALEAYNSAKSSLQINSPSKLFRNKIGGGIVEGLVAGLDNGHKDIKKAAARMALATVPDVGGVSSMSAETTAAATSNSSVYGSNNSTWNITVNAAPGQNEQEIANAVMSQINAKIRRQKGARA